MFDFTGTALVGYLLRLIKDALSSSPRFRNTLGEVTFQSSNQINFGDVQVLVRTVASQGTRLSPDYFMGTQRGRAILAKVGDKDGAFLEWVVETDPTVMDPGVYYLNVDSVEEGTRKVHLTLHKYQWREGRLRNAVGTKIYLRAGIDPTNCTYYDYSTGQPLTVGVDIQFSNTNYVLVASPVDLIQIKYAGSPLVPLTDYWGLQEVTTILGPTVGGVQDFDIPTNINFTVSDQDGYQLRAGADYFYDGLNRIRLSKWTPEGSTLSVTTVFKIDPTINSVIAPENILPVALASGEALATGQVFVRTSSGINVLSAGSNGLVYLPNLLMPGDWLNWEVRIDCGQWPVVASKMEISYLTELDSKGEPKVVDGEIQYLLPGVGLAFGDRVSVGDQVAIIVSPHTTDTYEVYGSKENLNFMLEVRSNDYTTSSEIGELLKGQLLILRRDFMEGDGITIYDITRDSRGEQRDGSGTAPRYVYTLAVSAAANWRVYVPLVTRIVSFDIENVTTYSDFPGKLNFPPIGRALGSSFKGDGIISSYNDATINLAGSVSEY